MTDFSEEKEGARSHTTHIRPPWPKTKGGKGRSLSSTRAISCREMRAPSSEDTTPQNHQRQHEGKQRGGMAAADPTGKVGTKAHHRNDKKRTGRRKAPTTPEEEHQQHHTTARRTHVSRSSRARQEQREARVDTRALKGRGDLQAQGTPAPHKPP